MLASGSHFSFWCSGGMSFPDLDEEERDGSSTRRPMNANPHPIAVQPGSGGGGVAGQGVGGRGFTSANGPVVAGASSHDLPPQSGTLCPASFWEDAPEPAAPVLLHVPHVRQSGNWDCGLACVQMVLR